MTMDSVTSSMPRSGFRRRGGPFDALLVEANRALQVLAGASVAGRTNPAADMPADAAKLDETQRRHAAGLMRVNHVGEICAQALYRGQAAVCEDPPTRTLLYQAAQEEVDHLAWCEQRLRELKSRPSVFNPLWYAASFGLGILAGKAGVPRNLGFMAETERQVEEHLAGHLVSLPQDDARSRAIVGQMQQDEIGHRVAAEQAGAQSLPKPIRAAMRMMSKVMTSTAYRV